MVAVKVDGEKHCLNGFAFEVNGVGDSSEFASGFFKVPATIVAGTLLDER